MDSFKYRNILEGNFITFHGVSTISNEIKFNNKTTTLFNYVIFRILVIWEKKICVISSSRRLFIIANVHPYLTEIKFVLWYTKPIYMIRGNP